MTNTATLVKTATDPDFSTGKCLASYVINEAPGSTWVVFRRNSIKESWHTVIYINGCKMAFHDYHYHTEHSPEAALEAWERFQTHKSKYDIEEEVRAYEHLTAMNQRARSNAGGM